MLELTQAFNDMLGRLESERRESGRRAVGAQEHERRRVALGALADHALQARDAWADVLSDRARDPVQAQDDARQELTHLVVELETMSARSPAGCDPSRSRSSGSAAR